MTERLARACASRPWPVVAAWIGVLAGSIAAIVLLLGSALTTDNEVLAETEASRAQDLISAHFGETEGPDSELAIVAAERGGLDDPELRARVDELERELSALGPPSPQERALAPDGTAVILWFVLGEARSIEEALALVEEADAHPGLRAELYGGAIVDRDFNQVSQHDLKVGEGFGIAAALVVLVLVFGALVAALVPLALALTSIVTALGLLALVGQVAEMSIFATNVIAGMGLALGIDYSLFVLSRYREERRHGLAKEAAIAASGATASRAVLFSGIAVVLALLGMLLPPDSVLRSIGVGAILVAGVSVAAALTLLPAVLALLGDRVNRLRVPLVGRSADSAGAEGRFWAWLAAGVMRRPLVSLVLAGGLMLAAAAPVLGLETGAAGVSTLPDRTPSKQGFLLLDETFSAGRLEPTRVVVEGDVRSADVQAALARLEERLESDPRFSDARTELAPDGRLAVLSVALRGDPTASTATGAVRDLRRDLVPEAFGGTGARTLVGGLTPANVDYVEVNNAARLPVFAFVLGLSFVLLLVAFRSVIVPVKAILLNLLSVGAAYGLLVLVFQHGVGNEALRLQRSETIEVWVPLLLFSLLFGLSMDYHVFLLSRIRERYLTTGDSTGSVAFGIGSTGRIITGAALIIIVVFTGFTLGELVMFQQMGFGIAVALLLDATLVRSVLVPASMRLLGEWNWYLPRWLSWLPHFEVEASGLTAASARRTLT